MVNHLEKRTDGDLPSENLRTDCGESDPAGLNVIHAHTFRAEECAGWAGGELNLFLTSSDDDGDSIICHFGSTDGQAWGNVLSVIISPQTTKEEAVRLLRKIADGIDAQGFDVTTPYRLIHPILATHPELAARAARARLY